jgi:hypothetical protein
MFVLIYALGVVLSALLVAAVLTIYIAFWMLAFAVAITSELVRSVVRWRRPQPKAPSFRPPRGISQAHFSDRR